MRPTILVSFITIQLLLVSALLYPLMGNQSLAKSIELSLGLNK